MHFTLAGVVSLLLLISFSVLADEKIPLTEYLQQAEKAGINIIYSSSIAPRHLKVSVDPKLSITIENIVQTLKSLDLRLDETTKGYVITRIAPQMEIDPIDDLPVQLYDSLEELIVTSSRYKLLVQNGSSVTLLDQTELRRRATIANDALRVVNQLPGSTSDGVSVRPRIRGGNEDETLIIFDGIRLYDPFHFKNFHNLFSTIDTRIIDSLEFYTGAFPARYGDKMSGVIKVDTIEPSQSMRELGIGLYNASYLQTTNNESSSWLLDIRRSVLEITSALSEGDFGKPSFADLYARYEKEFSGGNRLSANMLWFGDKLQLNNSSSSETSSAIYSNSYFWLRFDQDWSESLNSETYLSLTAVHQNRQGRINKPGFLIGDLRDYSEFKIYNFKEDIQYFYSDSLLMELGWDYRYMDAEYRFSSNVTISPPFDTISNYARLSPYSEEILNTGKHLGIYISTKLIWSGNFSSEIGLRSDYQHYEATQPADQLSPRIAFLYDISDSTKLRFSWGKFFQNEEIHEMKISDQMEEIRPPQKSIQRVISFTHIFLDSIQIRLEAYKKSGAEENAYFENLTNSLSLIAELQADRVLVDPDLYETEGVEFSIDNAGSASHLHWWFNYSYSSAVDEIDSIEVKRSWDQTHTANIGISGSGEHWQYTVSGSYHTGSPTTAITLDPVSGSLVIGSRNRLRFGHYMSWDLKFSRQWPLRKDTLLRLETGITNLLNRKNQIGVEYELSSAQLEKSRQFAISIAPFVDIYLRF